MNLGRMARMLGLVLLSVTLVACGGGNKNPAGPSDGANLSPEERRLLFDLNARFNDGRTIRFGSVPIAVALNGIGSRDEVLRWTPASGGRVTFSFVGGPARVTFGFDDSLAPNVCGRTDIFQDGDEIPRSDVKFNPDNVGDPGCANLSAHEMGHAIGILDHTSDGGLMDRDGGNGQITEPVARMVTNLYTLPPGTPIQLGLITGRARGRRAVISIVDYKR